MCLSLCVCVSACVCVCVSVCMCVHVWSVQVCECVWYLILFVIIHSCPSTLQSVNIFLTMFNKLVDQLEICEDKTLHAIKKFTTLFTGDVVHVMDHTWDDKAVVTLHFRTLGHLKHTQTQNATGTLGHLKHTQTQNATGTLGHLKHTQTQNATGTLRHLKHTQTQNATGLDTR